MGSQGWLPGAEEYRYRELSEQIPPEDRERILAENERCDRTGDPWQVEYRTLHKDGRVVWLRDHAVLVCGQHGEPDYWQGYYIDITEQRQAEEALRQALERERQALERERRAARELRATLFEPFRRGPGGARRSRSCSPIRATGTATATEPGSPSGVTASP